MQITIDLDKLTLLERLELVDKILGIGDEPDVSIPDWHREVLAEREELERQGLITFEDADVVFERIRRQFQ